MTEKTSLPAGPQLPLVDSERPSLTDAQASAVPQDVNARERNGRGSDHSGNTHADGAADAMSAALRDPSDPANWDAVDELAREADSPGQSEETYETVLARAQLPLDVAHAVGQRYVEFLEEWYEETDKPIRVLTALVRRDAGNSWALEKLSLLLTLGERWDQLLAIYDDCLQRTSEPGATAALLEEASRVAKDFAGQAQRASDYLKRLFLLRPEDEQLCLALERRLAEQERHQDLVDVWQARLAEVDQAGQLDLRVRITERYLSHLDAAEKALSGALELLTFPGGESSGCNLLERLAAREQAPLETRRQALDALKATYAEHKQCANVIRILECSKQLAPDIPAKVTLDRELVSWHLLNEDPPAAQLACASWLCLAPSDDDALEQLDQLAHKTKNFAHFGQALVQAASESSSAARRMQLLLHAAKTEQRYNSNAPAAIDLYSEVLLADEASTDQQLTSARALRVLLVEGQQREQRLDVLERLYQLEPERADQRAILVEAAQLAETLDDDDRALGLWEECLSKNPDDMVALDARVALLARRKRFADLLPALRARFEQGTDDEKRRSDLIWIAQLHELQLGQPDQAVAVWLEIEECFQRTNDTTDALANLYEQSGRWQDLIALLQTVEKGENQVARRTLQLTSLGDVYRLHQEEPARAVACYGQALGLSPRHEAARDGLVCLLDLDPVRREAAETLVLAYRAADEWEGTLGLVETRFGATDNAEQRQAVLLEAAELAEQRKQDTTLALDFLGRAFSLIPAPSVEEQILRLAASTSQWYSAVDSYSKALQHCDDSQRTIELLLAQGRVLEVQLEQWQAALDSYHRAVELAPDNIEGACAVVRVGGRLEAWNAAAWALIESSKALSVLRDEVVESFEHAAVEAWPHALLGLDEAVNAADLDPRISHDIKHQLAQWYSSQLQDNHSAIRVLSQAVDEHRTAASLEMLVRLQRAAPSAALVSSLLKLADVEDQPLPHLHEAAHVALEAEGDSTLARPILERSVALCERQLRNAEEDTPSRSHAGEVAVWSIEQLISIATGRGEYSIAFELLLRGAKLPLDTDWLEDLQHRAAIVAADHLDKVDRAIELCKSLLSENPVRFETVDLLARLYEAEQKYAPLIELRRDELERTKDEARRLELRLEISRVLGVVGKKESEQLTVLGDNLKEAHGHGPTIDAIASILTASQHLDELYELYTAQAELLGKDSRETEAALLFGRAGDLARGQLGDVEKALDAYRASVGLLPSVEALDALATIHSERGEYREAVAWLKHRLELTDTTEADQRQSTLVRLGQSLRAAGRIDEAIEYLSAGLQEDPSWTEVRELLSNLREDRQEWLEFATLLGEGVAFAQDIPTKVHYLKRAANVWWKELSELERAIPLLQRAHELVPEEQSLRLSLAEAQRLAGRLEPARGLLESLLTEFGRRRTPERANVHFQLALIERAEGQLDSALEQLDSASKIQRTDPIILKTLGDVAQQNGELERAETAYRALLLLVGRKQAPESGVGESAILFELYRIATQRQDDVRAKDLLDSALQAADQDSGEALRLEEALRQAGQWELLLDALQRRSDRAETQDERNAVLRTRAEALVALGRTEDAMEIGLQLLEANPSDPELLAQAEKFAQAARQEERFAEMCLNLAERLDQTGQSEAACMMWMRLGQSAEEREDLAQAASYYERAQLTGEQPQAAFTALRNVLECSGDMHALTIALERYVTNDDSLLDGAELTEALYRLAEHHLCSGKDRDQGLDQLVDALARQTDYARAALILETASELHTPTQEMVQLLEEAARALGDRPLLLKATFLSLERASLEQLREAVTLAEEVGDATKKETLLDTVIERARRKDDEETLLWSLNELACIKLQSGDFPAARELLVDAAKHTVGEAQYELWLQVATLEHTRLNNARGAAAVFERLSAEQPGDVRVWKPLLTLYRTLGEPEKLEACLSRAEEHADGRDERRALRLERIRLMMDADRGSEAESALRDALDDDPDNDEAAMLLVQVLEQQDRTEELQTLLHQLLDGAVARHAEPAIEAHSLKLGALLEEHDPDAAVAVYRTAHTAVRNNRGILTALLKHVPESDPSERADLLESLLPTEPDGGVEEMSLMLANLRQSLSDEPGIERAYELGFRRRPDSEVLRTKLLEWYREREHWAPLAELLTACALRETDPGQMNELLHEAAALYDTQLGDAAMAADVLMKGLERDPMSLALLEPACEFLVTAGRPDEAMGLLSTALGDERHSDESLALVYHLRAAVRARADEHNIDAIIAAIGDLETAGTIGGSDLVEDLATLLLRQQQLAELQGQDEAERDAVLRLCTLMPGLGQLAETLDMLASYCARHPEDVAAISRWGELAFEDSNWQVAIRAYSQLVPLQQGDAKLATVLRLAEAAEHSGEPLVAKEALEAAYAERPSHEGLSTRLRRMYEAAGAREELATLLLQHAEASSADSSRFQLLRDAGDVLLSTNAPHPKTIETFEAALEISPQDHQSILGLSRAHALNGDIQAACAVLENAIRNHGKKRSPELAELQYGMSQVALAAGDADGRQAWLDAALQSDRRNGIVASELAVLAMERSDYDTAIKALQLVTLLKEDGPMPRAEAYLRQAIISQQRGDMRKAVLLAKRALNADAAYEPARNFIEQHA